jgi:hypothetical protein
MNDEFVNQIHGKIGNDGDGSALYFSNILKQPFIRATEPRGPINLHANFQNTS